MNAEFLYKNSLLKHQKSHLQFGDARYTPLAVNLDTMAFFAFIIQHSSFDISSLERFHRGLARSGQTR